MTRIWTLLCLLIGIVSTQATASEKVKNSPLPDWVQPIEMAKPDPARKNAIAQTLLISFQTKHTDNAADLYVEMALLIQTPEGLTTFGNISLPWQPDSGKLLVHKLELIRDGTLINILSRQKFSILRREQQLENAILDGTLSASIQPEGMRVGDILRIAYTRRIKYQARGFKAENFSYLLPERPIRRYFVRDIWPSNMPLRWKATNELGTPREIETRWGRELILDLTNIQGPQIYEDAPARYKIPARLEVSGYKDWPEISATLSPFYEAAAKIPSNSNLETEIQRIATLTSDKGEQLLAALRLVQDNVRYFAVLLGNSGYLPANAQETWERKFGDCKGKSVTLIVLLRGLGIEAEPVLVHSSSGDMVGEMLPRLGLFDHVIVRARIGNQSFWLDATQIGDRDLDLLKSAPFHWGLPIRASGAGLERIPTDPPSLPLMEQHVTYDASRGLMMVMPVSGHIIYRGKPALMMRTALGQNGADELKRNLQETHNFVPQGSGTKISFIEGDKGVFTVEFEGWQRLPARKANFSNAFRFDDEVIEWYPEFDRSPPNPNIPFALDFPAYMSGTETLILPQNGKGFTLAATSFDRILAGTHIRRSLKLENGRAIARSDFRRIKVEISSDEAKAAGPIMDSINRDRAELRWPTDYFLTPDEAEETQASAAALIDSGIKKAEEGQYSSAAKLFRKARNMEPQWSTAHIGLALAIIDQRKKEALDEAHVAIKEAAKIDPANPLIPFAQGRFALVHYEMEKASEAFTKALELDPSNTFALSSRAYAYAHLSKLKEALADFQQLIADDEDNLYAAFMASRINALMGREEEALSIAEDHARRAEDEDESFSPASKLSLLVYFDRKEEAAREAERFSRLIDRQIDTSSDQINLIARKSQILRIGGHFRQAIDAATAGLRRWADSTTLLWHRCAARAAGSFELAEGLADCNRAVANDPRDPQNFIARGLIRIRQGEMNAAIADFDAALALDSMNASALYARGLVKKTSGQIEAGEKDIEAAKKYSFDIPLDFIGLGFPPR